MVGSIETKVLTLNNFEHIIRTARAFTITSSSVKGRPLKLALAGIIMDIRKTLVAIGDLNDDWGVPGNPAVMPKINSIKIKDTVTKFQHIMDVADNFKRTSGSLEDQAFSEALRGSVIDIMKTLLEIEDLNK